MHQKKLAALLSPLLCPLCKHNTLDVTTADTSRRGYANKLEIVCSGCSYGHAEFTSPQIVTDDNASRQPYEINHRAVLAAREVGIGQRELVKMLAIMNVKGSLQVPPSHQQTSVGQVASWPITSKLYDDLYGPCDGQRDITVSFDGIWHIKGHSSSVGACFVIDTLSGLVLDYVVLSKYCAECQLVGDKLTGEEKRLWPQTPWVKWGHGDSWSEIFVVPFCRCHVLPLHCTIGRWGCRCIGLPEHDCSLPWHHHTEGGMH